jgi:hypothetical protein
MTRPQVRVLDRPPVKPSFLLRAIITRMMRILYSLIGIAVGILVLKYSVQIYNFFGQDMDMERVFSGGLGGTHTFIKLFGLAIVIFSLFYMFKIFG